MTRPEGSDAQAGIRLGIASVAAIFFLSLIHI